MWISIVIGVFLGIMCGCAYLAVALLRGGAYQEDEHATMFDRM